MIDQTQARHKYPNIPLVLLVALYAYVERRQAVGHFLTAVLSNDLLGATQRADSQSQSALKEIVEFVYSNMPVKSYGSPQAVTEWLRHPANYKAEVRPTAGVDKLGKLISYRC